MTDSGFEVSPLGRKKIRDFARSIRRIFGINEPWFPIVAIMDIVLPQVDPRFKLVVLAEDEMEGAHGFSDPEEQVIYLRRDVYIGACRGRGRDRGTAAHEWGHLLLHPKARLERRIARANLPAYRTSEWQAKAFAGELLCSADHLAGCRSPTDLMKRFGVSQQSAEVQWQAFKKAGLLKTETGRDGPPTRFHKDTYKT